MTGFIVQGYPAYAYTGGREFDVTKPGVVMVHGAALDHSVWQWQSRYLAHHGFSVLAVDLPGHGRSPGAPRATVAALADWIAALLDAAGLARAAVVGHSLGGLAALEAALRHPARVWKLGLLGVSAPMPVGEPFLAAARDDSPAGFDMQSVWSHARNAQLAASPVPGMTLLGASRRLNGRARPGLQALGLEACHRWQPDLEAIRKLPVPTLVIAGRRDQMTPARAVKALAEQIPGARLVTVDSGHSMMSEAPRETLEALRGFLAG
jgi:pimeloyl-ACP methyl ester carboxylesterase